MVEPKGSDVWYEIKPNESETWDRLAGYELVGIRSKGDLKRTGVYVSCSKNREVSLEYFPPDNTPPFGVIVNPIN